MSHRNGRGSSHLSLVAKDGTPLERAIAEHGPDAPTPAEAQAARDASAVVGQAVMHAAMSWVACCMERTAERVEVQQVAPGAFHATVHFVDAEGDGEEGGAFMLSVALLLETGPRLTCQVEPLHP